MTITPYRLLTQQARAPFHKGASALKKPVSLAGRTGRNREMTTTAASSALTAPTQFAQAADDVTYAYRRFGKPSDEPLLMLQHFRGNIDNWDPAFVDALAAEREAILVDYAGVSSSTGLPPTRSPRPLGR
jgi:hypothetical protein